MREGRRVVELEPASPVFGTHTAWGLTRARMYDEALVECPATDEAAPSRWLALTFRQGVLLMCALLNRRSK